MNTDRRLLKALVCNIFTFYTYLTSFIHFVKTFTLRLLKRFFFPPTNMCYNGV